MRAVAHGWNKPGGGGPSRAVAREFVNADRKYSGGFAENRYWTGGLAAMNEINSGVPQTLNFQEGGEVLEPRVLDMGDFKDILAQGWYVSEGWTWDADTSTIYPPGVPTGPVEQTILGEAQPTTTTAPAPTTDPAPYYGGWDWSGYGNYADWSQNLLDNPPEPEPAPVRDIPGAGTLEPITGGTGAGESTGSQWTPEQIATWNAQQTASERQSPYRDQLREHKARIAATLGTGQATGGRVAMDELRLAMGGRGGRRRRGGGAGIRAARAVRLRQEAADAAAPVVRDIPGAAPQPGSTTSPPGVVGGSGSGITGAVFGAVKQLLGEGKTQWTPAQVEAWQTTQERQSPYRDRLRAHKARAADLLKPSPMAPTKMAPQPPVYGDKPEPGMAYPGGTPGFYAPGGPGRGGQLSGGGYGYEGDPSQPGYDDRSYEEFAAQQRITAPDITDEVLKARYEGRNANQGVIYTSGIAGAKGGYMNYQEGGAVPKPPTGGGAPVPGHQEGANPYTLANSPSRYRMWERKYHIAPPPPPPPPEPEEEPGFFSSLFGFGAAEAGKTRTERELEAIGEARGGYMRRYRGGGRVRGYQGGGLAMAAPVGGIPPWVEPAGYIEPEGYQAGGPTRWSPQQQASWRGRQQMQQQRALPQQRAGMMANAQQQQQQQALSQRAGMAGMQADYQRGQAALQPGGGGRWSPQQQQAWRGRQQQQAGMAGAQANFAAQRAVPQQLAGRTAGMMADYQAGQRGLQPGAPNTRAFLNDGSAQQYQQQLQQQARSVAGGQGLTGPWQGSPETNPMRPGRRTPPWMPRINDPSGGGGGITGGARVPPSLAGSLQKRRMMNRPPSNVGGGVNRVGQQDQQGGLSRALQRGTGRRPMSRRGGFPGRGMR